MFEFINVRACKTCCSRRIRLVDSRWFCPDCDGIRHGNTRNYRIKMISVCPTHAVETRPQKRGSAPSGAAYSCIDPVRTLDYSSMYRDWVKVALSDDDKKRYLRELMRGVYSKLSARVIADAKASLENSERGTQAGIFIVIKHVIQSSKNDNNIKINKLADEIGVKRQNFDRKPGMSDRPLRRLIDAAQDVILGWSGNDLFSKSA